MKEEYSVVEHNGYGSRFNIILKNETKNIIKKQAINQYGVDKLKNEIMFYNYIHKNNVQFPIPQLLEYGSDYIMTEFIQDEKRNINDRFDDIKKVLSELHNSSNIVVSKSQYLQFLTEETITKINTRYLQCIDIIEPYIDKILYVNELRLISWNKIIEKLLIIINKHVNNCKSFTLYPIHGDPQFNNILIRNDIIYFIDAKGSFGSSILYGFKQYDIAKMYFSVSGYTDFDHMIIDNINIINKNLNINFISIPSINDELTIALFISIWMGNAHIFKDQPCKTIMSHYIAKYFATYYIINVLKESIE